MSTPLLATKLYIPPPRPDVVRRPRLIERLNEALHLGRTSGVTLISAPAGFGKTTLLSSWLADLRLDAPQLTQIENRQSKIKNPVAWLSLDDGDNDPSRFLTYLVAALQTVAPDIGKGVVGLLHAAPPQPLLSESILTILLNDITTISPSTGSGSPSAGSGSPSAGSGQGFVLVLDDYHVIEAKAVGQALTFLLEHLPPQLHLVIATREDPPLPLSRLRVRGQLTELRAADLRFRPDEAATFLNQVMGLELSAGEVAALERRTEGWIAGLHLAALSLQGPLPGHRDAASFIKSFTGSHRFVLDYLVEEVLHQQPAAVQTFLLRTAILDRMCGPLCDAVLGRGAEAQERRGEFSSGQETLEYLDRANLFLVPLDSERRWYRYHHLFAELLRQRLQQQQQPDSVVDLHLRASIWYEQNGLLPDAVHHALAAEDFERTAALLELIWPAMSGSFQSAIWLGWARSLSEVLVRARPVLSMAYAWALLDMGELEAAELRLRDVGRWLESSPEPPPSGEMVVVDQAQFRGLAGSFATARSYLALSLGDGPGSVRYARQVLDLSPEDDLIRRGQAASLLALAHWTGGELEEAYRVLDGAMADFRAVGQIVFAISGTYGLADIRLTQGRLREAVTIYEQAIQLVEKESQTTLPGTADLYLGLGDLRREQGDLDAATAYLDKSKTLGEPAALPDWPYRFRLARSRHKIARGELAAALALLEEAERFYFRSPMPEVRPLAALKVRLWLALDRWSEAMAWVRERGLAADDDLSYLREFEHITLARVLIAGYRRDRAEQAIAEALSLLARLLQAAEAGGRQGSAIEILVQQALAHQAQGDLAAALAPLERALSLAEPEGYVRLFVDEGAPMAELLSATAARGIYSDYSNKLRAAFSGEGQRGKETVEKKSFPAPQPPGSPALIPALIEPLTERELEVLQLVAEGLSNREIGERLFLALSTVKGHNRNIYGKLQVQRRTEAVARARELGLL